MFTKIYKTDNWHLLSIFNLSHLPTWIEILVTCDRVKLWTLWPCDRFSLTGPGSSLDTVIWRVRGRDQSNEKWRTRQVTEASFCENWWILCHDMPAYHCEPSIKGWFVFWITKTAFPSVNRNHDTIRELIHSTLHNGQGLLAGGRGQVCENMMMIGVVGSIQGWLTADWRGHGPLSFSDTTVRYEEIIRDKCTKISSGMSEFLVIRCHCQWPRVPFILNERDNLAASFEITLCCVEFDKVRKRKPNWWPMQCI